MKKMKICLAQFLCLALSAGPAAAQLSETIMKIGVAAAVQGNVKAFSPTPQPVGRFVQSGKPLFLNEKVTTDANSRLQIMLLDETVFTIGPNSVVVLDEFVYDPKTNAGKVVAQIIKGVFRFVTGRVGHRDPSKMKVRFPVGTMGIRGTMVAGMVDPSGAVTAMLLGPGPSMNAPGERVGAFDLQNAGKTVEVTRPGYGSRIAGPGIPPTPPALIPQSVRDSIVDILGPVPVPPESSAKPQTAAPDDQASAAGQAGEDTASASGSLADTASTGELAQDLNGAAQTAEQADEIAQLFLQNLATWDQIRTIQTGGGFYSGQGSYFCAGGECGAGGIGPMSFNLNIDFAAQTIGGGSSNIQVFKAPGGLSMNDQTGLNSLSFAALAGPAAYSLNAAQGNHTNAAFDGSGVALLNLGGVTASAAAVALQYSSNTGAYAAGLMGGGYTPVK